MDEKGLEQYDVLDCLRVAIETKERGLVLTKAAQPSESILILPAKSLLNVNTLKGILACELLPSAEHPSHPYHWTEDRDEDDAEEVHLPLTSVQALTLALAQWKAAHTAGKTSRLDILLSSFPDHYSTFPIVWKELTTDCSHASHDSYAALLEALPTHVAHLCDKVHQKLERDCQAIQSVAVHAKHLLGQEYCRLSRAELGWAWCSVNSRCVYVPLGLHRHLDNFTLAPLLDMANHTFDKRLECKVKWTHTGGLQLFAPAMSRNAKGLEPGQEVFITYGSHSNGTLLSEYGFILPSSSLQDSVDGGAWDGNPYAEINVDHILEGYLAKEADDWVQQKVLLLQDHGYHGDYTIHPFPSPVHPSHRLVIALRLLVIKQQARFSSRPQSGKAKKQKTADQVDDEAKQIQAWEEMLNGKRDIVSAENEAAVCDLLLRVCDEIISSSKVKREKYLLTYESAEHPHVEDVKGDCLQTNITLVMDLLREEERIARMMQEAIRKGLTDW